jgi:hypothetical protein
LFNNSADWTRGLVQSEKGNQDTYNLYLLLTHTKKVKKKKEKVCRLKSSRSGYMHMVDALGFCNDERRGVPAISVGELASKLRSGDF